MAPDLGLPFASSRVRGAHLVSKKSRLQGCCAPDPDGRHRRRGVPPDSRERIGETECFRLRIEPVGAEGIHDIRDFRRGGEAPRYPHRSPRPVDAAHGEPRAEQDGFGPH